ncbi:MAG TPA: hypothetical protein DE038_09115 [Nitrospina sp.]|nr:hypothetical protein [Nitrospina sp.]|tara:strand:+ start:232 stop:675 length:444 start_codon:yes stop_codon:yes gene_type:complete
MSDSKIPEEGVSGKIKAVVYILTGITVFAFVAFFTKLITKKPTAIQQEKSIKNTRVDGRSTELEKAGERLQQVGLNEQALDNYILIWTLGESNATDRAKAAATTGRLYLKLGNCKEALVWLFRSEAANPDKATELQPLIDTCIAKEK